MRSSVPPLSSRACPPPNFQWALRFLHDMTVSLGGSTGIGTAGTGIGSTAGVGVVVCRGPLGACGRARPSAVLRVLQNGFASTTRRRNAVWAALKGLKVRQGCRKLSGCLRAKFRARQLTDLIMPLLLFCTWLSWCHHTHLLSGILCFLQMLAVVLLQRLPRTASIHLSALSVGQAFRCQSPRGRLR
jgi:hypothetical protein